MILEHRAAPPFFKNGFVVGCEETREGVIVDPGDEVDQLLEAAAGHGLSIKTILLTHAHLDHITGVGKAKAALGVPIWLHPDDNFLYEGVVQQGQMFGLRVDPQPPVDHFYDLSTGLEAGLSTGLEAGLSTGLEAGLSTELEAGLSTELEAGGEGPLRFGRYTVRVRHTPGHCPGGVCLAVSRLRGNAASAPAQGATADKSAGQARVEDPPVLFVGDTLFAGSIGRTDLPGGDLATLLRSIRDVLFSYPDDTVVWSGHGEPTTIGREKRTNPFLI